MPLRTFSSLPSLLLICMLVLIGGGAGCGEDSSDSSSPSPSPNPDVGDDDASPDADEGCLPPPTPEPTPPVCNEWTALYQDLDRDGFASEIFVEYSCYPTPGTSRIRGDCNDHDATIYPGAEEQCDGIDHNCDLIPIYPDTPRFFLDEDGDGFGVESDTRCMAESGYSPARGDCDDGDSGVHPGARDVWGDGSDNDCGGTDAEDPHVGFNCRSYPAIQMALVAAQDGMTIWVGPGVYPEHLSWLGKAVAVRSTQGPDETVVSAGGLATAVQFVTGEGPDSILDGLSIQDGWVGYGWDGAGVRATGASPTIMNCWFRGNSAQENCQSGSACLGGHGGGAYLESSSAEITDSVFVANSGTYGGGLALTNGSTVHVSRTMFIRNAGGYGGGLAAYGSSPLLDDNSWTSNYASADGGAVFTQDSTVSLHGEKFSSNQAGRDGAALKNAGGVLTLRESSFDSNYTSSGDVVALSGGSLRVSDVSISNNDGNATGRAQLGISETDDFQVVDSEISGGTQYGIYLAGAGTLQNCRIQNNRSFGIHIEGGPTVSSCTLTGNGGGGEVDGDARFANDLITAGVGSLPAFYAVGGSPLIDHCTIAGNRTDDFGRGGGIYYAGQDLPGLELNASIVAYNWGYNLKTDSLHPGVIRVSNTDLYNPVLSNHDLKTLDSSNLELQPDFMLFSDDGNSSNDDFHLPPDSPLKGLGGSARATQESSGELGMYGGTGADRSYYFDQDGDGLYDGWETLHGLDITHNDAALDPDADGLSNLGELKARTDPWLADSDGDQSSDGLEVSASSSPVDWYSQPGQTSTGEVVASVPADFPTIQEALDAIQTTGTIEVSNGTFGENLRVSDKQVSLRSASGAVPVISGSSGSVLSLLATEFDIRGLKLTNGSDGYGGGARIGSSEGRLSDMVISGNSASAGGAGIATLGSRVELSNLVITGNEGPDGGGGLYLDGCDVVMTQCALSQNRALNGGGFYAKASSVQMSLSSVVGNYSELSGGGGYMADVTGALDGIRFSENTTASTSYTSGGSGGGLFLTGAAPSISHSSFINNSATFTGGGVCIQHASPSMNNNILQSNRAESGGGISLDYSTSSINFCTVVDNQGGGVLVGESATPSIQNSILAYNEPINLVLVHSDTSASGFHYNDIYNPGANAAREPALDLSNRKLAPGFIVYSNDGNTNNDDFHLVPASLLINAGDPEAHDPDGSGAELGAYGGPAADRSYYADLDHDGMYDAWESAHGLDPTYNDANLDKDSDGLTNLEELNISADPTRADTDGDGVSDGSEVNAGSAPGDFYSQPGVTGYASARVPRDFPTIQRAIDAMQTGGDVEVEAGSYPENVAVVYKDVKLIGLDGASETRILGDGTSSVVLNQDGMLVMSGFTLSGGSSSGGPGIRILGGQTTLSQLSISHNMGGGISWDASSDVSLADSLIFSNNGLAIDASGGSLSHCRVYQNENPYRSVASLKGVTVEYTEFSHNVAGSCAVYAEYGLTMNHSVIVANELWAPPPTDPYYWYGTGLCLSSSYTTAAFSIQNSIIAYNSPLNVAVMSSYPYSQVHITYSDMYNPKQDENINSDFPLDLTTTTYEPDFLTYDSQGLPANLHLGVSSPLVGIGAKSDPDPDGSSGDMGLYGGEDGDLWDLDDDGYPDYFWPGTRADAPEGYVAGDYDCNDMDPSVGGGESCVSSH